MLEKARCVRCDRGLGVGFRSVLKQFRVEDGSLSIEENSLDAIVFQQRLVLRFSTTLSHDKRLSRIHSNPCSNSNEPGPDKSADENSDVVGLPN